MYVPAFYYVQSRTIPSASGPDSIIITKAYNPHS